MELIYFWIKSYCNIKNCGFNLSPNYYFKYDNDNKILSLEKQEEFEYLFTKDIKNEPSEPCNLVNMTCIVGENGSGKTTVMQHMMENLTKAFLEGEEKSVRPYLNIYRIDGKLICIHSKEIKVQFEDNCKSIVQDCNKMADNDLKHYRTKVEEIYYVNYTNAFDRSAYGFKTYGRAFDLSFMGMMYKDLQNKNDLKTNNYDVVRNHINQETFRQVNFVVACLKDGKGKVMGFPYPEKVKITLSEKSSWEREVERRYSDTEAEVYHGKKQYEEEQKKLPPGGTRDIIPRIKSKMKSYKRKDFIYYLFENIVISAVTERILSYRDSDDDSREMRRKEKAISEGDLEISLNNYVKEVVKIYLPDRLQQITDFMDDCQEFIEKYCEIDRMSLRIVECSLSNHLDEFEKLFRKYRNINPLYPYFEFSWEMSTGEDSMLSFMARLYSIVGKNGEIKPENTMSNLPKKISTIILCLDETDLYFHPRWQQRFVKVMIAYLRRFYKNYKVQVIMTTHSPIMLSDMPSGHVIRLRKGKISTDKRVDTFGNNIYDLFTDAFFLNENSNGVIGEYANDWQEYIYDEIQKIQSELREGNREGQISKELYNEYKERIEQIEKYLKRCGTSFIWDIMQEKVDEIKQLLKYRFTGSTDVSLSNLIKSKLDSISPEERMHLISILREESGE